MMGPGKYDSILTQAREAAKASGAILLVFEGEQGCGFSCQVPAHKILLVPSLLREMAQIIETDWQHQSLVAAVDHGKAGSQ